MKKLILFAFPLWATFWLLSCQPTPKGGDIGNTNWVLYSIMAGRKNLQVPTTTTLIFEKDKLTGNAPCNSYFASFSTQGTNMAITDLGSTERACDALEFENTYLGLLTKANSYSVGKDKLEIFCENGRLVFTAMPEADAKKISFEQGVEKLSDIFPTMEGGAMIHLYPILKVDNPGNYPYKGTLVDTAFYPYFDAETSNVWNSTGGDVFAVGKSGDLFVCRVPGRYVSSDIAIFQLKNGEMARSETVAWAWCDEGWCNQQDAWLMDVDKDGTTDIVQRYSLTDDKGKIREERLTVLTQTQDGTFKENPELKPDKAKFPMAKI